MSEKKEDQAVIYRRVKPETPRPKKETVRYAESVEMKGREIRSSLRLLEAEPKSIVQPLFLTELAQKPASKSNRLNRGTIALNGKEVRS